MNKRSVAVFTGIVLGMGVLLFADVKTDYDHHTDFAKYHTYSWIKVQAGNQLWQQRITEDVDHALESKGWQKVPSGGDVGVTAFGATQNVPTLDTFYTGLGGGWGWRGFGDGMATTTVENNREGTLTVDLFDNQTKKLIWRGTATNSLSGDPEKNAKKLASTVDDMFKHFPPKSKG
jgi:hypothetical protein